MIAGCLALIIFWVITATPFVGGCFVSPTSVVATVGERALLNCTTHEGGSISSWYIWISIFEKTDIYTAPVYKPDGTIRRPEKVAQGYFVTRPADNKTILQINKTILSQAGLYVCTCYRESIHVAGTTVVVLDSEPKFTTDNTGVEGEPIMLSCSISFNASSDVSCELKMEDASGSTVARRNESTMKNGLIVCNLELTVKATASADQWYTCNVTLRNKGDIIYSRVLNATVEWQQFDSTSYILTSEELQREGGKGAYQVLAFPITLAVACVIITILSAATTVFYRKYRKLLNVSDANKLSTEDNPAHYTSLDVQISCEAGQRETYTEIQLPIYLELN